MELLQLIEEHALAIIAALGGTNILIFAASMVKVFTQKNLNKTFDHFKSTVVTSAEVSSSIDSKINVVTSQINTQLNQINKIANDLQNIKSEELFEKLKDGLMDLETVKLALAMKDELIEAYGKDIREIKAALIDLRSRGE